MDDYTLPAPAGAAEGDVLVAFIGVNSTDTIGAATGWTEITTVANASQRLSAFYIVRGGSAPSMVFSGPEDFNFVQANVSAWTGVDGTTPIDVFDEASNSSSSTPTSPTVTATGAGALVCHIGAQPSDNDPSITVPSGMTERANLSPNSYAMASLAVSGAGATGAKTWAFSPANVSLTISLVLKEAAGGGGGATTRRYSLSLTGVG